MAILHIHQRILDILPWKIPACIMFYFPISGKHYGWSFAKSLDSVV